MEAKKTEKVQVKVQLTPAARDLLQQLCEQQGMLQIEVISRLIEWFSKQEKNVQAIVLGQVTGRHVLSAILRAVLGSGQPGAIEGLDELEAETGREIQEQHSSLRGRKKAS